MTGLHIVIVPAWWPSVEDPMAGVFCADYAAAFAAAGAKVGIIFPDLVGVRHLGKGTSIPWIPRILSEAIGAAAVIRVRGLHTALGRPGLHMRRYQRWLRKGLAAYRQQHGSPDVLHAMCAIPAGWACTHLEDPLADRVVVTEHTGPFSLVFEPPGAGPYVRAALNKAAAVLAVSERSRDEMQAAGIKREIVVCGNPLWAPFTTTPVEVANRSGPRVALFVGRLVREKGIEELIEAAVVLGRAAGIEWHFVGEGPMAAAIGTRFLAAGLIERLRMHGHCDRATVARMFLHSDVLVLPTHGETFGLVAAEALCMGLPVVTTRDTACGDYINDDNGVAVQIGDAKSLAAGVRRVIDSYERYDRPTIAARARERFSIAAVSTKYGEIFRQVAGRG